MSSEKNFRGLILALTALVLLSGSTAIGSFVFSSQYVPFKRDLSEYHEFLEEAKAETDRLATATSPGPISAGPESAAQVVAASGLWHYQTKDIHLERRFLLANRGTTPVTWVRVPVWMIGEGPSRWSSSPLGYAIPASETGDSPLGITEFDEYAGRPPGGKPLIIEPIAKQVVGVSAMGLLDGLNILPGDSAVIVVSYARPIPNDPVHAAIFKPSLYPHLRSVEMHVLVADSVRFSLLPDATLTQDRHWRFDMFQPKANIVVTRHRDEKGDLICLSSTKSPPLEPIVLIFKRLLDSRRHV